MKIIKPRIWYSSGLWRCSLSPSPEWMFRELWAPAKKRVVELNYKLGLGLGG